jgi:hypothetical protein
MQKNILNLSSVSKSRTLLCDFHSDPFKLRIATDADEAHVDSVRQAAYATAGYFSIPDPEAVTRRTDPADSICFVIANRSIIAATIRVAYADTQPQAQRLLQGPAPLNAGYFPTATLCRGATSMAFRRQGLMAFLVSVGVAVASRAQLSSTTGMQAVGTPHYEAMLRAGWQSQDVTTEGERCIQIDESKMKLVHIDADRFELSEAYAHTHFDELYQSLKAWPAIEEAAARIATVEPICM